MGRLLSRMCAVEFTTWFFAVQKNELINVSWIKRAKFSKSERKWRFYCFDSVNFFKKHVVCMLLCQIHNSSIIRCCLRGKVLSISCQSDLIWWLISKLYSNKPRLFLNFGLKFFAKLQQRKAFFQLNKSKFYQKFECSTLFWDHIASMKCHNKNSGRLRLWRSQMIHIALLSQQKHSLHYVNSF